MIKYIFKRDWRLQNLVIDEVNGNISEIIIDLCKVIICSSRKWEFYYDVCSRLNELMKLRKWTKDYDAVAESIRCRFNYRFDQDYLKYFSSALKCFSSCYFLDENVLEKLFNKIINIYNSVILKYYSDFLSKKSCYIYPDDIDDLLEELFKKYFPNFDQVDFLERL